MNVRMLVLLSAALVLISPPVSGSAWFLSQCPPEIVQKSEKTRGGVRGATPGSVGFVPHPYPNSPKQVFEDFVYQFRESWSRQSPEGIPKPERNLLSLLKQDAIRYQVLRVTEWRAQRCSRLHGQKDELLLLRLFADTGRQEIARVTLRDSGILATLDFASEPGASMQLADGHRLESFEEVLAAAKALGLQPKSLQYVAVGSPTLACYESIPCVAFRHGHRVFLFRSGTVFELGYQRVQISNEKFIRDTPERREAIRALGPREHVVSLGGDAMTIATPVDPP